MESANFEQMSAVDQQNEVLYQMKKKEFLTKASSNERDHYVNAVHEVNNDLVQIRNTGSEDNK